MYGWIADFPDPADFLNTVVTGLRNVGWQNKNIDRLLKEAARTQDRAKRMAMYRQVDHLLVADESLVLIFAYSKGTDAYLVKPWVKNYSVSLLGKGRIPKHTY